MYNPERLATGIESLANSLDLDIILIDTSAGINDENLFSLAISDTLVIIMRPDQQDYQGTAVITDLARKFDIPRVLLVVNTVSKTFDHEAVKKEVEQIYAYEVAAVLPVSDQFMGLLNQKIFVLDSPHNPLTLAINQLANNLLST
jgi:MinD-like ATPase involved in chromosome partitioning or flagellar assembly